MSIFMDEARGLVTLQTKHSSYQMKRDPDGLLLHTYYGSRIHSGDDMSHAIARVGRGFSGSLTVNGTERPGWSEDVLPLEYSCFGVGDYRASALKVRHKDGSRAVSLRVRDWTVQKGKYALKGLPALYAAPSEADTLLVRMEDPYSGLAVELQYGVVEELDLVTRAARIINRGKTKLWLEKAASLSVDWQFGEFDWISFHGRHTMERIPERQPVRHGIQSIGTVRGTSSHHYNPFSILCTPQTTETQGLCFGVSLVYSGEFLMELERDQANQTRLVCGIHPDDFCWELKPGESFQTPEVLLFCSDRGFDRLSQCTHRAIRDHICRGIWKRQDRPVLINNWEATYFDFTGDKLIGIAREAAALGIELFVMDDGWFGKRDNDHAGLGDWFPNEKKLGCSLRELGDKITETGMQFGIWFEPEAVNKDSDLYRAHPEWAVQIPGRDPNLSRDQLVLDFSNRAVQDYLIARITEILSKAPISYVKWDMNRSICDKYSTALDAAHQGEFAHRYVLGLYRVLDTLTTAFPKVLFEGCSGGGGRFDAGMLYYMPQIWCSDNTDAINRLSIQYGSSFGYPISAMGSHVSAVPNHQTGRITPFATRAAVAMAGTFGYELDIRKLSEDEKEQIRSQIRFFRRFYPLIQGGDYHRLSTPEDLCIAWSFTDPAPQCSEAVIQAVQLRLESNGVPIHLYPVGLHPEGIYELAICNAGCEDRPLRRIAGISGAALMQGGVTLPVPQEEYHAWTLLLKKNGICAD